MPDTSGITSGTQNPYDTPNYGGASKSGSKTGGTDKNGETTKAGASSSASDPYATQVYSHASTDYNTLTITDYFKLLSAQLANQDMNNPMSNSEMMAQMVQMAMVQSVTSMNEVMENMINTMENQQIISTQTYAAGLIGQEVTVSVTETVKDEETGEETIKAVGSKTGIVASVNFTSATPTFRLEGDDTDYPITYLLGMGKVDVKIPTDPDEGADEDKKPEGVEGDQDKTEGTGGGEDKTEGAGETGGMTGTENAGGTDAENTGTTGDAATDAENAAGTGAVDPSGSVNTQPSASGTEDENTTEDTEEMGIAV